MSETANQWPTIRGSTLRALGVGLLGITLVVSAWAFVSGDWVTGLAVLLYLPIAALLFAIGRGKTLV
ncbi:MAG: hypothetical protein ACOCP3_03075 [Halodesulfurarchaeum sp.]